MSDGEDNLGLVVEFHPSPYDGKPLATVSGVDIYEAGDGYNHQELRAISRILQQYADLLEYERSASAHDTPFLFDLNSQNPENKTS